MPYTTWPSLTLTTFAANRSHMAIIRKLPDYRPPHSRHQDLPPTHRSLTWQPPPSSPPQAFRLLFYRTQHTVWIAPHCNRKPPPSPSPPSFPPLSRCCKASCKTRRLLI